jgi:hypothetical protein
LGCDRSRFDRIFSSLSSEFGSKEELKEAEGIIQHMIDVFVTAYLKERKAHQK